MAHKRDYKPEDILFPEQVITESELVHEMQTSYIDYAMSVIVGRALPDVRGNAVDELADDRERRERALPLRVQLLLLSALQGRLASALRRRLRGRAGGEADERRDPLG